MDSKEKTITALEAGSFSMPERQWAGLKKVAAQRVFEDMSKPSKRSLGTMVGLDKRTLEPLLNRGLVKSTAYRRGSQVYEDITTTELGRRALATRGISYPVRYPETGDVDPCPKYSAMAAAMRARRAEE